MRALAVFHDRGAGPFARVLRRGFRHVFVAVELDTHWLVIDGKAGVIDFALVAPRRYDLASFYRDQGYAVVETAQGDLAPRAPIALANCVGLAKAVLAVRCWWAITPFALYCRLIQRRQGSGGQRSAT
jgi:hypothetical protein